MGIFNRTDPALVYLKWWDILILTIIMFGFFIWTSWQQTIALSAGQITGMKNPLPSPADPLSFTSSDNWSALFWQLILLGIALLYLYLRNFDFSQWTVHLSWQSLFLAAGLFVGVGLAFDLYYMIVDWLFASPVPKMAAEDLATSGEVLGNYTSIDLSLLLYSALNGIYEEMFFLGICLSVRPEHHHYAFIYSLIVRYSFHTYQGQSSAIGIALVVGGLYYAVYTTLAKYNLLPFFLSHALKDIFGTGIISYFF